MSTGSKIAQLRCERNWSQTNLASKMGTNVKSVKDWEDDVSLPTAPNIKKLCAVFGTICLKLTINQSLFFAAYRLLKRPAQEQSFKHLLTQLQPLAKKVSSKGLCFLQRYGNASGSRRKQHTQCNGLREGDIRHKAYA